MSVSKGQGLEPDVLRNLCNTTTAVNTTLDKPGSLLERDSGQVLS